MEEVKEQPVSEALTTEVKPEVVITPPKPKVYQTEPSEKQRIAFNKMVENGGNKGKVLLESGYSPAVAKNPQKVMESKGWKQLQHEHFPEETLAKVHEEGLQATKTKYRWEEVEEMNKAGEMVTKYRKVPYEVPDPVVRHKYLDTAYKVMGKYPKEGKGGSSITNNFFSLADLAEKSHKRKQMGLPPIKAEVVEIKETQSLPSGSQSLP